MSEANTNEGTFHYQYGVSSNDELTELQVLLLAFKQDPPPAMGGIGRAALFWKIVEMLWGEESASQKKFVPHPWAERMTELACEHEYLGISGSASCVAGSTRILNPITGEQPTIQELCERIEMPIVMTTMGPVIAGVPFLKGKADLYEVVLSDGNRFIATAEHRVLTPSGYEYISSLVSQRLQGYAACHPRSTSDIDQRVHASGAHHSQKTTEDCPDDCFAYFHRDGGLLRSLRDIAQSFSPSPADVRECMEYVYGHSGGSGSGQPHNHPYLYGDHLSIAKSALLSKKQEILSSRLASLGIDEPGYRWCQQPFQWRRGMRPHCTSSSPSLNFSHRLSFYSENVFDSCANYPISPVAVQAISRVGYDYFYDMHVPVANHYFAEGAIHHNSGKSLWGALWGMVNWMADPENTLVLVTSTSLKDSRRRIWGCVKDYYMAVQEIIPFGHLVDSQGVIRTLDGNGNELSDKCGIALIPGERSKESVAIGKLIGMKNKKVFMIADELPELSEALISAAMSNLAVNPSFQMIGLGNFKSIYDPLGVFITPKNGWASVTVEDEEWETTHGYCLHLDGVKSPNVLAGEDIYPIYNLKNLKDHQKRFGENSALFWRMCRSFPSPEGETNAIYSDADFIMGNVDAPVRWLDIPYPVACADPAFTTEGDAFSGVFGLFGRNSNGLPTLLITNIKTYHENVDLTKKGEARDLQTARMFASDCTDHGCRKEHVGVDCSGPGGLAFGSIFSIYWGNRYLPIKFAEVASDLPVSQDDKRKGHEAFVNLASELWFVGKSFVRSGQFKGITTEVAKQLKARYYKTVKRGDYPKIQIESKVEMKKRIGQSPDQADASAMLLFLCRHKFGFYPGDVRTDNNTGSSSRDWMDRVKKSHEVYESSFA